MIMLFCSVACFNAYTGVELTPRPVAKKRVRVHKEELVAAPAQ